MPRYTHQTHLQSAAVDLPIVEDVADVTAVAADGDLLTSDLEDSLEFPSLTGRAK